MPDTVMAEHRSGPRYVAAFPVRAEWDTADGAHVVSEGETENVGPEGTLIHLQRELPPVGSTRQSSGAGRRRRKAARDRRSAAH